MADDGVSGERGTAPHGALPCTVKFWDRSRGFGFVLVPGGVADAFLHAETLRRDGAAEPSQGDVLSCTLSHGSRGLQVQSVVAATGGPVPCMTGRVKFYDAGRGYGFVLADGGEEVFVGAKLLRRLRLAPLREDQAVRVTASRGERGWVAETLSFVA
jgi:cold shock CspA family protein